MMKIVCRMVKENRLYNQRNERSYVSKVKRIAHTAHQGELGSDPSISSKASRPRSVQAST